MSGTPSRWLARSADTTMFSEDVSRSSCRTHVAYSLAVIGVDVVTGHVSRETFLAGARTRDNVSRETSKERAFRWNTSPPWVESGGLRHLRDDLVGGINTDTGTLAKSETLESGVIPTWGSTRGLTDDQGAPNGKESRRTLRRGCRWGEGTRRDELESPREVPAREILCAPFDDLSAAGSTRPRQDFTQESHALGHGVQENTSRRERLEENQSGQAATTSQIKEGAWRHWGAPGPHGEKAPGVGHVWGDVTWP